MSEHKESKRIKKCGHRKKKFGHEESKVISFWISKTVYENNKDEIRDKIMKIIETEVKRKNQKNNKNL